ncbi:MAG: hypothetical protein Q7S26_03915 [bacterium]|nr:hypothetical protein [bacterium]
MSAAQRPTRRQAGFTQNPNGVARFLVLAGIKPGDRLKIAFSDSVLGILFSLGDSQQLQFDPAAINPICNSGRWPPKHDRSFVVVVCQLDPLGIAQQIGPYVRHVEVID